MKLWMVHSVAGDQFYAAQWLGNNKQVLNSPLRI